jgi:hypothetical protein
MLISSEKYKKMKKKKKNHNSQPDWFHPMEAYPKFQPHKPHSTIQQHYNLSQSAQEPYLLK